MNNSHRLPVPTLLIAAVERDTGLSKDTVRAWERRYAFPLPSRDGTGERAYALEQVEKLRSVKRLLDAGHCPGRILPLETLAMQQSADDHTVDQPHRQGGAAALFARPTCVSTWRSFAAMTWARCAVN